MGCSLSDKYAIMYRFLFFGLFILPLFFLAGCGQTSTDFIANVDWPLSDEDSGGLNQDLDAVESTIEALPEETFMYDTDNGYYGSIVLKGYLSIQTEACAFEEETDCKVDLARFHFERPDNEAFRQFVADNEGNSFIGSGFVSLGCYDSASAQLTYFNAADSDGEAPGISFEGAIDGEDFEALMASRDQTTVTLFMERPIYTGGKGAPDCYSHFRNFKVFSQ